MNAIRLVTEDAADPDNPKRKIRRQRVYDPIWGMKERKEIEQAHWLAAERFRDRFELADGAREQSGAGRLEAWQRCHYAERVADARQEVRTSLQAVGLRLGDVFVRTVIQRQPIRHMERELRMKNGTGTDRTREALDALARHQAGLGR